MGKLGRSVYSESELESDEDSELFLRFRPFDCGIFFWGTSDSLDYVHKQVSKPRGLASDSEDEDSESEEDSDSESSALDPFFSTD